MRYLFWEMSWVRAPINEQSTLEKMIIPWGRVGVRGGGGEGIKVWLEHTLDF